MKIILRVSVQQSRWMIKRAPYVNCDIREKTSCCDIIETHTVNNSPKRGDAVPQIEGYTPPPLPPPLQDQYCGTEHGRTTDSRQTVTTQL